MSQHSGSVAPYRYTNSVPQRARRPIQAVDLVTAIAPASASAALHEGSLGLLALVRRSGPCSVAGLAAATGLPTAVALVLASELEYAGLVGVTPCAPDHRPDSAVFSGGGA